MSFPTRLGDQVVVSNIFYVHPYLGKIPILTNIFQRNHQLGEHFLGFCPSYSPAAGNDVTISRSAKKKGELMNIYGHSCFFLEISSKKKTRGFRGIQSRFVFFNQS